MTDPNGRHMAISRWSRSSPGGTGFDRRRLLRDALVIVGVAWFVVGWFVLGYHWSFMVDARAYYAVNPAAPYAGNVGDVGVFTYSPPLAAVFLALHNIPEPVFLAAWMVMNVVLVMWLLWRQPLVALMLAMPISDELLTGQIELLMVASIVLLSRTGWTLPILAKATTGVGLLWFVVRREWSNLAVALGLLVSIIVISVALTPSWWADWIAFVARAFGHSSQLLGLRILVAGIVVVWAARSNRRWALPVAALLALPVIWIHSFAMLAAIPRLRARPLMDSD